MVDTISSLRVIGFKSLADVDLRLAGKEGVTVLIGNNGSGKSALVEACEILRRATGPQPLNELASVHGFPYVIREDGGLARFEIELAAREQEPAVRYGFSIRRQGAAASFEAEALYELEDNEWRARMKSDHANIQVAGRDGQMRSSQVNPNRLTLAGFTGREDEVPVLKRVIEALNAIDVQMPFLVRSNWYARSRKERSALREPVQLRNADGLERGGENLVSVFQELKNRGKEWEKTLEVVRLGLGDDVEDIRVRIDAAGYASLQLKRRAQKDELPMSALSDGTLAFLCFVALYRADRPRSLLVFDEPELHLHPGLLARVMDFFVAMGDRHPVLLATHSNLILDLLGDPADQTVLMRLDPEDKTRLERPNREVLGRWLESYSGLGSIRAEGHEASLFVDTVEAKS